MDSSPLRAFHGIDVRVPRTRTKAPVSVLVADADLTGTAKIHRSVDVMRARLSPKFSECLLCFCYGRQAMVWAVSG